MCATQTRARPNARPTSASNGDTPRVGWRESTWALALTGQLLLWAALPPLGWGALAWLAPVPWVLLIRRPALSGRRPYFTLWTSAFVFWLAALYWVTLPHWATAFGWLAISFYLAFYFAAFIAVARVAVHLLGVSVIVAAPIVWVGLELARAYLLSGFAMASIAHTQYRWPWLIQTSDALGFYGVSFTIVLAAACLGRMLPLEPKARPVWWPLAPLAAVLAAVVGYGAFRAGEQTTEPGPKVALVQGSIDVEMKYDPGEADRIFDEYYGLSQEAVREHADLDLIVWPETMFRDPWYTFGADFQPPPGAVWTAADAEAHSRHKLAMVVRPLGVPCLFGVDRVHYTAAGREQYNSALFSDGRGTVVGVYDKCHLVPFGEFVPFADRFPWLYQLTPLPGGSRPGAGAESVEIGGVRYGPNICYENTIPQLVRAQVVELRAAGSEPDVLVNLTNDGWFWGSAELDMHLACAVFRAVECRKPFLIAANTGFSAWIDSTGRILAQGRRRKTDLIVATVAIDRRHSWYLEWGDLPAALCLAATCGVAAVGLWRRRGGSKGPDPQGN